MTKGKLPRLPFLAMKEAALGRDYELSLVFVPPSRSRELNRIYRGKDRPANVLAFPLGRRKGELVVDMTTSKRQDFGKKGAALAAFIVIHGLVHLKGHDHGVTMERIEARLGRQFGF